MSEVFLDDLPCVSVRWYHIDNSRNGSPPYLRHLQIRPMIKRREWAEVVRWADNCVETDVYLNDECPLEMVISSWEAIAWRITNGDPPSPETIAMRLDHCTEPIPKVVRLHIADLLAGRVKVRRGPRQNTLPRQLETLMRRVIVGRVVRLARRLKGRGIADSYHVAIEHVATRTEFSEHTLDSWVHPRQR